MDATGPDGPPAQESARLRRWRALTLLVRQGEAEMRARLRREFGMSLRRFEALSALHRAEAGLRMSELAAALAVSKGAVTALVDALAAEGLVIRAPDDEDRRAATVRLTRRGRQGFAAIAAAHEGWIEEILGGLSGDDLDRLGGLVARIRTDSSPA